MHLSLPVGLVLALFGGFATSAPYKGQQEHILIGCGILAPPTMDCSRMGYTTCERGWPSETNRYHRPYTDLEGRDVDGGEEGPRRVSLDFLRGMNVTTLKRLMPRSMEVEGDDPGLPGFGDDHKYAEPADYDGEGNQVETLRKGVDYDGDTPAVHTNQTVTPLPGEDPNTGDPGPRCCMPTWDCWNFMRTVKYKHYKDHMIIPNELHYRAAICCFWNYWKPKKNCPNGPLMELPDDWWEPPGCSEI